MTCLSVDGQPRLWTASVLLTLWSNLEVSFRRRQLRSNSDPKSRENNNGTKYQLNRRTIRPRTTRLSIPIPRDLQLPTLLHSSTQHRNAASPAQALVLPHPLLVPPPSHLPTEPRRCTRNTLVPQCAAEEAAGDGGGAAGDRLDE